MWTHDPVTNRYTKTLNGHQLVVFPSWIGGFCVVMDDVSYGRKNTRSSAMIWAEKLATVPAHDNKHMI